MSEELWQRVENIGLFIGILMATFLVAFLVNRLFGRLIKRSANILNNDPTNYQFLRHAVIGLIYLVGLGAAIYTVPSLRTIANSLLAGAGILAVAVGFASQHALSNIISGVFIVIFKPYRINDRLQVRELEGIVEDITLRHTVIRDYQNKRILIPNAIISDEIIINLDLEESKICKWIELGISYDSDVILAKQIIKDEILKHPLNIDTRTPEQIKEGVELAPVRVISMGDSSVNLRGWAWAENAANGFRMQCDLLESIKARFDQAGIEIPFPYRTIVHKDQPSANT
jgi:small conductance mechanosensitive channel